MVFVLIIVILLAVLFGWYTKVYNSPNARAVRALTRGKTPDQAKAIEYFCKEGCMTKTISDEEYEQMVFAKRDSMNFKKRALDKIGLDEEEVSEIKPVCFQGYEFHNAYAKKTAAGKWVSSAYQVSWIFFSATQVYLYTHTFNMDEDKKSERTDEFFYRDVTSFSTISETDTAHGLNKDIPVTTEQFAMVVPGDKLTLAMSGSGIDATIQGMKQKLREKKM